MEFLKRNMFFIIIVIVAVLMISSFNSPKEWLLNLIYSMPGIIIAISFREFGHALASHMLGDPTPSRNGRLTLNPLVHIDLIGILILAIAGFGWGKSVETDSSYYMNRKAGTIIVSFAGILMNLLVAIVFSFVLKFLYPLLEENIESYGSIIYTIILSIIFINIVLMIFHLLPIPPLDGFDIVAEVFNLKGTELYNNLYRFSFFIMMFLIAMRVFSRIITPIAYKILGLLQYYIIF